MSAVENLRRWRENPLAFVVERFKIQPDEWQADALRSLQSTSYIPRRRLTMKSCTGAGKSTLLAWVGWWRLVCFAQPGEHPKGAALSGEGRENLRDNLWAELAKWRERDELLKSAFTWTAERISSKAHPETWFLSARSYPKDADPEAIGRSLSGLHSKFPFVLLDENGDMPITVGQKAEQIFTGGLEDGLVASAGNPTSTTGLLYAECNQLRANRTVITITADPNDPKRTPRVDKQHAEEQIATHGRENPWVMSTILGEFPKTGFANLLSIDQVEQAMRRQLKPDVYEYSQKRLGVDVARFGDDRSVIFPRQGLNAAAPRPVIMRSHDSIEVASRVIMAKVNWTKTGTHDIAEFVDGTGGYGAGVIDYIKNAGHSPFEVQAAGKATDPRFANKRAECWWLMAEWVKSGALPNLPELVKELTGPKYTFVRGQILIEPKDQIKKRLGFSPDLADALAQTFALPDMPAEKFDMAFVRKAMGHRQPEQREYNPFTRDDDYQPF